MGTNDNAQARSRSPRGPEPPAGAPGNHDPRAGAPPSSGAAVAGIDIRAAPPTAPPPVAEPTTPREPPAATPEQQAPRPVPPTALDTGADPDVRAQSGSALTTAPGLRLSDTDHSLK